MRSIKVVLPCAAMILVVAGLLVGQTQGPLKDPGSTVARPRKTVDGKPAEEELPKIPPKLKRDPRRPREGAHAPRFRPGVAVGTRDVAVGHKRGPFIPGFPAGNFRVLEDNVPQQI